MGANPQKVAQNDAYWAPWSIHERLQFLALAGFVFGRVGALLTTVLRTSGYKYWNNHAGTGVVIMFFWVGSWDPYVAVQCVYAAIGLLLAHKFAGRPAHISSMCRGTSYFTHFFGIEDQLARGVLDPLAVAGAGCLALGRCDGLAYYAWAAAAGMVIEAGCIQVKEIALVRQHVDARADAARQRAAIYSHYGGGAQTASGAVWVGGGQAPNAPAPKRRWRPHRLLVILLVAWVAYATGAAQRAYTLATSTFDGITAPHVETDEEISRRSSLEALEARREREAAHAAKLRAWQNWNRANGF